MRKIDVCLSPALADLHAVEDHIVVVVDILRATSCMVTGMASGVDSILPVMDLDLCKSKKKEGYFIAGERDGKKVEGFDLGNSPFDYMKPEYKGKKIAVTTTNGTVAFEKSRKAHTIIAGSFLNLSAVAEYILNHNDKDCLIMCAGWKGKVNLEDTLFAGALVEKLSSSYVPACDAPILSSHAYNVSKEDLMEALKESSHVKRLLNLNITKDIEFCLSIDTYNIVPVLKEGELTIA